jgi:hypothetical protein
LGLCFSQVGGSAGAGGDMATTMLQKFWDSAMALEPPEEDDDSHRLVTSTHVFLAMSCHCCNFVPAFAL